MARAWRGFVLGATACVAVALVAEAAVRVLGDAIPEPDRWSTPELPVKWSQIERLAADGGASVVFAGSSVIDVGVDPALVSPPGGDDRPAYNAGLGAGSLAMITAWTRDIVVEALDPSVVVLAISSRELNPNDPQQRDLEQSFFAAPEVVKRLGTQTWLERVEDRATSWSELVRKRAALRDPRWIWSDDDGVQEFPVGPTGVYEAFLEGRYEGGGQVLQFLEDTVLNDYAIGAREVGLLRSFVDDLVGQGIDVVIVVPPVTDDFVSIHPGGETGYAQYVDVLRGVAAQGGTEFVEAGVWDTKLFSDPVHVNADGLVELSRLVDAAISDL